MAKAVWCIRDKNDIWCAVASDSKPDETDSSVQTVCSDWIILPHGTAKREPTCPKCRDLGARG